jgi:Uma2 family endonuclease
MTSAARNLVMPRPVVYPETDGEPMGETDLHIDVIIDARTALKRWFHARPDVYVSGNVLIYYEEGEIASRFSPDVFVVFGVPKGRRRVYKLWEEKRAPSFVLEVSSRGTRLADKGSKMELCAELGVKEYFLFDPEGDYLKPPLQGYRLARGEYRHVPPLADGSVASKTLGLVVSIEGGGLRFVEAESGKRLLRVDEQADRSERLEAAEDEIRRLKAELAKAKR